MRTFADRKAMEQHESYHKRVHLLIEHGDLEVNFVCILINKTHNCDADYSTILKDMVQDSLSLDFISYGLFSELHVVQNRVGELEPDDE